MASSAPPAWVRSRRRLCPAAPLRRRRPGRSSCRCLPGCLPAARMPPGPRPSSPAPPPACSSSGTRRCSRPGRGSWLGVEGRCCLLMWKQTDWVQVFSCCTFEMLIKRNEYYWSKNVFTDISSCSRQSYDPYGRRHHSTCRSPGGCEPSPHSAPVENNEKASSYLI